MKNCLFFTFFLFFSASILRGQEPNLGASKSLILVKKIGREFNPNDPLQEQSIKAFMMPPRRQGGAPTSACYAVASVMEYYSNVNSDYKINLSPDFIHLNIAKNNNKDTLNEAFNFVIQKGTVSASIVPYGSKEITAEVNMATRYKIKNFIQLYRPTTQTGQKLYEIKKALTRGNPVIILMNTPQSFRQLGSNDRTWTALPDDLTNTNGQMTLIVVSFDERRKAFELRHSGGSEWGNRGYIWVKFDDLARFSTEGVAIVPND